MDSLVRGRIWPNGEFVLWRRSPSEDYDPEVALPIGLSKVANSHSLLGEAPKPVRRGLLGITTYGQKMVENAAYLLQKVHGAKRLSFLTCTLPGKPEHTLAAAENWAEIVRVFYQSLGRELERWGLDRAIVGVTEIQPKRFLRTGGMPLHLHAVFQGAAKDYLWCIAPDRFTEMWRSAVTSRVPELAEESFASAVNVQKVRDNAAGYLGKYMSKGEKQISELLEKAPALIDFLPSTWYNMTVAARDMVKLNMAEGEQVGLALESATMDPERAANMFRYAKKCVLENSDGDPVKSFWIGHLYLHQLRTFGLPCTGLEVIRV